MNLASWIVLGILIIILTTIIFVMIKSRSKGCLNCNKENCPIKKIKK